MIWKGKEVIMWEDIMNAVVGIAQSRNKADAKAFLNTYASCTFDNKKNRGEPITVEEAERIAKNNISYGSKYYEEHITKKIRRIFDVK